MHYNISRYIQCNVFILDYCVYTIAVQFRGHLSFSSYVGTARTAIYRLHIQKPIIGRQEYHHRTVQYDNSLSKV